MKLTWKQTRELMREDKERLLAYYDKRKMGPPIFIWLNNSYMCSYLYRMSRYFFTNDRRVAARFFWHLNLILTGADISPVSDIDGGFVVTYPLCVIVVGKIGKNCTIQGHGGLGGGREVKDIGGGPGLPVLGDEVEFAYSSLVLGPVRIGDRSFISSGCFVTKDIPDDSVVEVREPRKRTASE